MRFSGKIAAAILASAAAAGACRIGAGPRLANPVLFVAQVPVPADFATVGSTFANHHAGVQEAARGGDLYIRYPDGRLRNLTKEAGYGEEGRQGAGAIAVRDPCVHWSGEKAVFAMVVGAPTRQYDYKTYRWQLYEIAGLGEGEAAVATKVPNQPPYNNVSPIYATDDRILFTSDRPRGGEAHLYPQRDEYESTAVVTGLWSLDPGTGDLRLLNHSPSGAFTPQVDSFGRVVFTRWDHLQRDQQADADERSAAGYGTFDYASEAADAARLDSRTEVFPEPRSSRTDLLLGTNLAGHTLNHFFPWEINEDGTAEETLNHVGRHELHGYFDRSLTDDPNLVSFSPPSGAANARRIGNFFQMKEDPARPGDYYGVDAAEFGSHASGQIVAMTAPLGMPADAIAVRYVTHRATAGFEAGDGPRPEGHSGLYRDPLPTSDGALLSAHADTYKQERNDGSREAPKTRYGFRVVALAPGEDGFPRAGEPITPGIVKEVSYWDPDVLVTWSGPLWELQPAEVRARPRPAPRTETLPAPEAAVFAEESVDPAAMKADLAERGLALIVSRDVTTRDAADRQQPFNLRVPGGVQTVASGGKVYDVAHLQIFQGDLLRGMGGTASPREGRRVLARTLHDPAAVNLPNPGGPEGSVRVAPDGSTAALVPARRALSWQLTDGAGTPVVRERYWLTFQPGEVRVCASCHGANSVDQAGDPPPENPPEALRAVLRAWKAGEL